MVGFLSPSTSWSVQLARPEKVRGVLEVGAHGKDLVNEILHANDAVLAQLGFDQVVGGDGGPLTVDLDKSSLVDELAH